MSVHSGRRKAMLRVARTQAVRRGLRLAMWQMARARRRELPCIAEVARVLEAGATPVQIEQAEAALSQAIDVQPRLI